MIPNGETEMKKIDVIEERLDEVIGEIANCCAFCPLDYGCKKITGTNCHEVIKDYLTEGGDNE